MKQMQQPYGRWSGGAVDGVQDLLLNVVASAFHYSAQLAMGALAAAGAVGSTFTAWLAGIHGRGKRFRRLYDKKVPPLPPPPPPLPLKACSSLSPVPRMMHTAGRRHRRCCLHAAARRATGSRGSFSGGAAWDVPSRITASVVMEPRGGAGASPGAAGGGGGAGGAAAG